MDNVCHRPPSLPSRECAQRDSWWVPPGSAAWPDALSDVDMVGVRGHSRASQANPQGRLHRRIVERRTSVEWAGSNQFRACSWGQHRAGEHAAEVGCSCHNDWLVTDWTLLVRDGRRKKKRSPQPRPRLSYPADRHSRSMPSGIPGESRAPGGGAHTPVDLAHCARGVKRCHDIPDREICS